LSDVGPLPKAARLFCENVGHERQTNNGQPTQRQDEHGAKINQRETEVARNALKHGLSVSADPISDNVRSLAALLLPVAASDHIAALAVEAARRIIDFDRVRVAHQDFYARLGSSPSPPPVELTGLEIAAGFNKDLQPPTAPPLTITDLAKHLDKLARYERRSLSLRERALRKLADEMAGERLQNGTERPDRPPG
jgi:hypothetical protein